MIIFTRHFLERMRERKISEHEIRSLLDDDNAKSDLNGFGNTIKQSAATSYLLRIIFRRSEADLILITVYKTSKMSKYSEREIRK